MQRYLLSLTAVAVCLLFIGCIQTGKASPEQTDSLAIKSDTGSDVTGLFPPEIYDSSKIINWYVKPGNTKVLTDGSGAVYLYVHIRSGQPVTVTRRAPLNLSLVLDRSGSMAGDKIDYAKRAAKFLVDQLDNEDYLSIINYDDRVEVTSRGQAVKNKEVLKLAIDRISDRGSTNLSGGMLEGYAQLKQTKKEGYVNRVLLLTDGLANAGITDPQELKRLVGKKYNEEELALSTFGLGADYNEDLLTLLAETGRANYYFIDSPDKIPGLFARELKGLLSVVAQNALVQINIPEGLHCEKVYGYPYEVKDNKLYVKFNDIYANDEKVILIKLKAANKVTSPLKFNCMLTYTDAQEFNAIKSEQQIMVVPTADQQLYERGQDSAVYAMLALFESTEQFDTIMQMVDQGNYEQAKASGRSAIELLKKKSKEYNSPKLEEQVKKMNSYIESMDSVRQMHESERKLYQKANKSVNYEIKKQKRVE